MWGKEYSMSEYLIKFASSPNQENLPDRAYWVAHKCANVSLKGQIAGILGFADHTISVTVFPL